MRSISVLTILLLVCAGCQTAQVRNHSVDLDAEVPSLYNQLVLDNVAMALESPCNMPYFGTITQNSITNSRTATVGATATWSAAITRTLAVPFTGSDQNQAAIQLAPISDPNRLELLRELFRAAACSSGRTTQIQDQRTGRWEFDALKRYFDAHSVAFVDYSEAVFGVPENVPVIIGDKPPKPVCVAATACVAAHLEPGRWPTNYQILGPWLCVEQDKHRVPKDACYVGHYCHTSIWVPPQYTEQLRRLTAAALDIATVDLTQMTLRAPSNLPPYLENAPSSKTRQPDSHYLPQWPVPLPPAPAAVP